MTREEIEKLEGQALVDAVAERVMEWHRWTDEVDEGNWVDALDNGQESIYDWRPDQNIAQAYRVMRARPNQWWKIDESVGEVEVFTWNNPWWKTLASIRTDLIDLERSSAEPLCIAICRAALLAVSEPDVSL